MQQTRGGYFLLIELEVHAQVLLKMCDRGTHARCSSMQKISGSFLKKYAKRAPRVCCVFWSGPLEPPTTHKPAAGLRPLFLGFNIKDSKEFRTSLQVFNLNPPPPWAAPDPPTHPPTHMQGREGKGSDIGRSSQLDYSKELDLKFSELYWSSFLDSVQKNRYRNKMA